MAMGEDRLEALKQQITNFKTRWPAHSIPPAMMEQLDALEEQLSKELQHVAAPGGNPEDAEQALYLRPIGYVENGFGEPATPENIRSAESRLVIDASLVEGLQGFEVGQRIMVVFYFHRSKGYELLQHPRGDPSLPKRGIFTLHSPNRPNPIGVTIVDLISVQGNVLRVNGLDAINNTPLLDLKLV
jgi:tRNA-Thr(GGU) m(6)t(6)A37 methyltransferase TsaA